MREYWKGGKNVCRVYPSGVDTSWYLNWTPGNVAMQPSSGHDGSPEPRSSGAADESAKRTHVSVVAPDVVGSELSTVCGMFCDLIRSALSALYVFGAGRLL